MVKLSNNELEFLNVVAGLTTVLVKASKRLCDFELCEEIGISDLKKELLNIVKFINNDLDKIYGLIPLTPERCRRFERYLKERGRITDMFSDERFSFDNDDDENKSLTVKVMIANIHNKGIHGEKNILIQPNDDTNVAWRILGIDSMKKLVPINPVTLLAFNQNKNLASFVFMKDYEKKSFAEEYAINYKYITCLFDREIYKTLLETDFVVQSAYPSSLKEETEDVKKARNQFGIIRFINGLSALFNICDDDYKKPGTFEKSRVIRTSIRSSFIFIDEEDQAKIVERLNVLMPLSQRNDREFNNKISLTFLHETLTRINNDKKRPVIYQKNIN